MIEHVRRRVMLHPHVDEAIVTTSDPEIFEVPTIDAIYPFLYSVSQSAFAWRHFLMLA